ncbi:hypothetical protein HOY82DRAFT_535345 [Tuber indicum]|nr:hypothetical protein HOY82DRAFT_535345 [Tuber indicum]
MAEYNYSRNAATVFLNALLADLEMAKAGSESRALMMKPELIGEPGEGAERGAPVRDLSDGVEGDINVKIRESKDTSTASSGVTSHLPVVAVATPQCSISSVNHSAMSDPSVWPLQNSSSSAFPGVQERSTTSSSYVTLFSTRFPDENNNHLSPLTTSLTTPTSGSKNNDSVPASSTTPAPQNATSTVVPVHRPVRKANEIVANKTTRLPWDIAGPLEDRIAEAS